MMVAAQIILVITLLLMISGRVPLYITAAMGAAIAAVVAGYSLMGTDEGTVTELLRIALNPVILDMAGVLMFIGILQHVGYLDVIVARLIDIGRDKGGAPGVATAAGLAAALLGAVTSFTQPVVMATVAGPAATRLGLSPNATAGTISMANTIANQAGFTHPTFLAVLGLTGVKFGIINVWGFLGGIGIFIAAYFKGKKDMLKAGIDLKKGRETGELSEMDKLPEGHPSFAVAVFPFLLLVVLFFAGFPVFLVGMVSSIVVLIMTRTNPAQGESAMVEGVKMIAIPVVAVISLMFLSTVVSRVGLIDTLGEWMAPVLEFAPVQILFIISAIAGTVTQSFSASAPIILPFTTLVLGLGADPVATSFAAISGAAIMQLFLSGGALTALPVVVGVVPGSNQREANKWQRPCLLIGLGISFLLTFVIGLF
ncbi:di/tricarboxylate transporter [Trueperella bonasi]|uniref:Di/tricarboxylate transporter n=1 Tax=Trueperella bonasi TaxID=312286 RepID=A0ABT9NEC4_9ACTO|nr:hypothetical protein [Trueperella bonasi]MDP9805736.1 di/tricarboxylate transporter [Trueperella bonasi]